MSTATPTIAPVTQPFVAMLPAIYQGEEFLGRFLAGLDAVLAPVISALDSLHAYVDPAVAPGDFLEWLSGWVGLSVEEDWAEARRRRLIARASEMYARRGTAAGIREEIELYTGGRVAIENAGGVTTSRRPSGETTLAGRSVIDPIVTVIVEVEDASTVSATGLRALVRAAVPAHLPVKVELRTIEPPREEDQT